MTTTDTREAITKTDADAAGREGLLVAALMLSPLVREHAEAAERAL